MHPNSNRVLLITAAFPPQVGGASEKMAKRVKFLQRFGWHTTVLAPAINPIEERDEGLAAELELEALRVERTDFLFRRWYPSLRHDRSRGNRLDIGRAGWLDLFFVPRGYIRWLPFALARGLKLTRNADVILTMNNPVTLHLIGLLLHLATRKPWVAEIRDPIVGYAYGRRGPEELNRWLERLIFTKADAIIQKTDFVPGNLADGYPELAHKFTRIPFTGFDPDDFPEKEKGNIRLGPSEQPMHISYTGNFYGSTITPICFLKALKLYTRRDPLAASNLRVFFAGSWQAQYDDLVHDLDLQDTVSYLGWLGRQDCLDLWDRSQLLLLLLGPEEENLDRIPSKFWDYLGARRPILALVAPEGRLATIIREQNLGFVANPEDPNEIAKCLSKARQTFLSGDLKIQPQSDFLRMTSRIQSEKILAEVLKRVLPDYQSEKR